MSAVTLMRAAGFEPDPWQRRVLLSTSRYILLLASRQSGKSQTTAALALHTGLFRDNALVLLASPTERQSEELFRKIIEIWNRLDRPVAGRELKFSVEFANRSRIIALPGDPETIRCFSSVDLVILDEAARIPDAMFAAVSPMISVSRGRLLLLTTPMGRRGVFFDLWNSDPSWEKIRARASECPRYEPDFLDSERRRLGERWYAQEYESEFISSDDQVFSQESIDAAFDSDLPCVQGW
jgi:hypothetical protein